jgi:hypothetical protein
MLNLLQYHLFGLSKNNAIACVCAEQVGFQEALCTLFLFSLVSTIHHLAGKKCPLIIKSQKSFCKQISSLKNKNIFALSTHSKFVYSSNVNTKLTKCK